MRRRLRRSPRPRRPRHRLPRPSATKTAVTASKTAKAATTAKTATAVAKAAATVTEPAAGASPAEPRGARARQERCRQARGEKDRLLRQECLAQDGLPQAQRLRRLPHIRANLERGGAHPAPPRFSIPRHRPAAIDGPSIFVDLSCDHTLQAVTHFIYLMGCNPSSSSPGPRAPGARGNHEDNA